jgi:hypothetical protein
MPFPPDQIYAYLSDFRRHHPRILPPAFSDFQVEEGGVGAGTVMRYRLTLGGRTESHRSLADEPEPGRVMTETLLDTGIVTTFTVEPQSGGSSVTIASDWHSGGLRGLVERLLAPRMLRRLYIDELARLEAYAREQAGAPLAG